MKKFLSNKKVRKVLLFICVVVFLFCAYNLGKIAYDYWKISQGTDDMIEEYVEEVEEEEEEEEEFDPLSRTIDFESLLERNSDVVGWIYIPGTNIDEALLQGDDNDEYLRADVDGEYNYAGSLFMSCNNSSDLTDMNSIIYGHNMKNGTRFHDLRYYINNYDTYFEEHPMVYIYLPDGSVNCYQIIASATIDSDSDFYSIRSDYEAYIEEIESTAYYKVDYDEAESPIIMLSTCHSSIDDARYVVWAKLTENLKSDE